MERWLSGLKQQPAKLLGEQSPRGFESLPLRQKSKGGKKPAPKAREWAKEIF